MQKQNRQNRRGKLSHFRGIKIIGIFQKTFFLKLEKSLVFCPICPPQGAGTLSENTDFHIMEQYGKKIIAAPR